MIHSLSPKEFDLLVWCLFMFFGCVFYLLGRIYSWFLNKHHLTHSSKEGKKA